MTYQDTSANPSSATRTVSFKVNDGLDDSNVLTRNITVTPAGSLPVAPSSLAAIAASSSQINLSWQNNAANAQGFLIERQTGAGGWTQIATVAAGATSYQDATLAAGTAYSYRLRAYNAAGDSAYASPASAATAALPHTAHFEFGTSASPVLSGYTLVTNSTTYSTASHYGWSSGVIGSRDRGTGTSLSMHLDYTPDGTFLVDVPNGTYQVNLLLGDSGPYLHDDMGIFLQGVQVDNVSTAASQVVSRGYTVNVLGGQLVLRLKDLGGVDPNVAIDALDLTSVVVVPAAPTSVTASGASASQINLSWQNNSGGVLGFLLERETGTSGNWTQIATLAAGTATYQDTSLPANGSYSYRLRAYNTAGNSPYSAVAAGATLMPVPAAPSSLSASAVSASQINISWQNNATNAQGFLIERQTGAGSWTQIASVAAGATSYQDTSLAANTAYSYRVRAYNIGGDSAYCNTIGCTTMFAPPASPTNLAASVVSASQINLSWQNSDGSTQGFYIERETTTGGTWTQIAALAAGVRNYQDTSLASNTSYSYRLRAYNTAGDSAYSAVAAGTTLMTVPAAPSGLLASVVTAIQINLSWQNNASNAQGVLIEREIGTSGAWTQIASVAAGATTYQDTSLATNTSYSYRLRAYNNGGDSGYSAIAAGTTLMTVPAAPSGLAASVVSASQINLSWHNNATNAQGFLIERETGASGTWTQIATVTAATTTYQDTSLAANTSYSYRLRAYNNGGDSGYSAIATSTTLMTVPAAPSGLVASVISSSQINLSWQNNAANAQGVLIEREIGTSGAWTQIASVAAGTTSYQNTSLAASTAYSYRVRAYNNGGDSAYSLSAAATTLTPSFAAHFEFGTSASPVQSGYTLVTNTTTYSLALRYGWSAGVIGSRDRGTGPAVNLHLNYTPDGTFLVDLPNGTYQVSMLLGDAGAYWHDDMGIFLQGVQVDNVSTTNNQVVSRSYTVTVTNGQLTLHLKDLGGTDPNVAIESLDIVAA